MKKQTDPEKKRRFYSVLSWILIVIALAAVAYIAYYLTVRFLAAKSYRDLQDAAFSSEICEEQLNEVTTGQTEESSETVDNTGESSAEVIDSSEAENSHTDDTEESLTPAVATYKSPVDFDYLTDINPDVYAWIVINHMDISYPILQREGEDQHYLVYDYRDVAGNTGAIYTHDENAKDFTDFNTVIYGHNLWAGGMFTDLEKYMDETFLKEHREITIFTPNQKLSYTVFAAVVYNSVPLLETFDYSDPEVRQEFLDSLSTTRDLNSHVLDDIEVTPDDHIITLSTCVSSRGGARLLILAKLTDVKE